MFTNAKVTVWENFVTPSSRVELTFLNISIVFKLAPGPDQLVSVVARGNDDAAVAQSETYYAKLCLQCLLGYYLRGGHSLHIIPCLGDTRLSAVSKVAMS